jgi:hypothetical protein
MAKMRVRPRRSKSDYPAELAWLCQLAGLPRPERELVFAKPRRWRFDLAWPSPMVAVEVDGGGFVQGRHSRGVGMERDAEKFAEAAIRGWTVIRCTPKQVRSGEATAWLERLIGAKISGARQ